MNSQTHIFGFFSGELDLYQDWLWVLKTVHLTGLKLF